jgi:hypothetical protein
MQPIVFSPLILKPSSKMRLFASNFPFIITILKRTARSLPARATSMFSSQAQKLRCFTFLQLRTLSSSIIPLQGPVTHALLKSVRAMTCLPRLLMEAPRRETRPLSDCSLVANSCLFVCCTTQMCLFLRLLLYSMYYYCLQYSLVANSCMFVCCTTLAHKGSSPACRVSRPIPTSQSSPTCCGVQINKASKESEVCGSARYLVP